MLSRTHHWRSNNDDDIADHFAEFIIICGLQSPSCNASQDLFLHVVVARGHESMSDCITNIKCNLLFAQERPMPWSTASPNHFQHTTFVQLRRSLRNLLLFAPCQRHHDDHPADFRHETPDLRWFWRLQLWLPCWIVLNRVVPVVLGEKFVVFERSESKKKDIPTGRCVTNPHTDRQTG